VSVIEYKGYQGAVDYEDGQLVIKILHINDSISTNSDAASEVPGAFADLVEDYLETCRAIGKPPEKPFSGTFNVRIGSELHRAAARAAARQGVTLNAWICAAIKERAQQGTPAFEVGHHHYISNLLSLSRHQAEGAWVVATKNLVGRIEHIRPEAYSKWVFLQGHPGPRTPVEVDFKGRHPKPALSTWKN
jgi:predicted HicB family RNase H-like nuclease